MLPHLPSVLLRWPAGSVKDGWAEVLVVLVVIVLVVVVEVGVVLVMGCCVVLVVLDAVLVVVTLLAGWPGRPGLPRQAPKLPWQPAPQYSIEEPHQKNCEQQGPQLGLPMHMVLLPHMPLVVTWRDPVGTATEVVDVGPDLVVLVV